VILIGIYPWNIIFFLVGFFLKNVNIKISHNNDWTMFRRFLNYSLKMFMNVEIEHEWTLYTHTICIAFHVLVLKVVIIYYEPSLIIVLKEFKCMRMSYIIINPWPSWTKIYEYFDEFINLCIFVYAWCILVSMIHKIWNIWRLWSWLMSS
jgi:hypothetical protein